MVCSEIDFKYPLAYARGSVFLPDHVAVAKYQKLCGIGLKPVPTGSKSEEPVHLNTFIYKSLGKPSGNFGAGLPIARRVCRTMKL
jgi:hypothetical protein